jgi:hypothetical protein
VTLMANSKLPALPVPVATPVASPDIKCEDYLPSSMCHVPELPSVGDIPWWVWAVGGVGTAGFATLAYASFKAAPYVMPIMNPETAPLAKAWLRHRAGHDKADIAHEALTALREQRARKVPRTKEELQLLREEALKEMVSDMLARRRMKQLAKATT